MRLNELSKTIGVLASCAFFQPLRMCMFLTHKLLSVFCCCSDVSPILNSCQQMSQPPRPSPSKSAAVT